MASAHEVEVVLLQLFGEASVGAGGMRLSDEAAEFVHETYAPLVSRYDMAGWPNERFVAFEWARAIGRHAADLAATRGDVEVAADDVRQARETVSTRALRDCPFCP